MMIDAEATPLGDAAGKKPAQQHLVRGETNAGDYIGGDVLLQGVR